jgi:hypothetical protein
MSLPASQYLQLLGIWLLCYIYSPHCCSIPLLPVNNGLKYGCPGEIALGHPWKNGGPCRIIPGILGKASAPRQLLLHCSNTVHPWTYAHAPYLHPCRQLLLRCSTSCVPAVVPSTPSGPSSLRCDVQIRSRRICRTYAHRIKSPLLYLPSNPGSGFLLATNAVVPSRSLPE